MVGRLGLEPTVVAGNLGEKRKPFCVETGFFCEPLLRHSRRRQNSHLELQLWQCASVTTSFLESPATNRDVPKVKTAAVALAPLTPFFRLTLCVRTAPFVWQCGHTKTAES